MPPCRADVGAGQPALPSREAVFAALRCPFPARQNPYRAHVGRPAKAWLERLFGSTPGTERLLGAQMDYLTAGFYPEAGPAQLEFATNFLHWAFTLDDLVDETDIGRVTRRLAVLFDALDVVLSGDRGAVQDPIACGLSALMQELEGWTTPQQLARFREATRAYFGAMLWEANNRACDWVPDEVSFKLLRPAAGAVPPFWELIGPINGVSLSLQETGNPDVERLSVLAGRIVCWYNDLLSYEKERDAEDVHNLVLVYIKRRALSAPEAFQQAIDFCNSEVEAFSSAATMLLSRNPSVNLRRFIETLESIMATTLQWTFDSRRYSAVAGKQSVSSRKELRSA